MTDQPAPRAGIEVSFIIPCYNEQENVEAICAAVAAEARAHARSYEIILIDNASTDTTRDLIRALCAREPHVRAIFNNRNYGQMRSPTYAIYQAEGAAVIAMCADFQDPPALIGPLIAQWRAGAQIVLGQRLTEKSTATKSLGRVFGYGLLTRIADYPVVPGATGFGLFDRVVVDALAAWNEPEPFFRGMVVESGYRIALIPFDRPERERGTTSNNLKTLIDFFISGIAGSSKRLLRQPLMLAPFLLAIAGLFLLGSVAAALLDGPWMGLLIIAVQFAVFGVTMLFIGLIGEQIRLISERTRSVPLVLESERLNFPPDRAQPATRTHVQPFQ